MLTFYMELFIVLVDKSWKKINYLILAVHRVLVITCTTCRGVNMTDPGSTKLGNGNYDDT